MNERIRKMAEQAGLGTTSNGAWYPLPIGIKHIEHFYEMAFEAGRMAGFKQDKALTELARIGQEIERGENQ